MAWSWREEVQTALQRIGGEGSLQQIYDAVERNATRELPPSWKAIVRRELEYNSSDSQSYKRRFDLFHSVKGIGTGIWGLRSTVADPPIAKDISPPERFSTIVSRIIRDTRMSRQVKQSHGHRCQLCDVTLTLPDGSLYSEGHHIQPLGEPHNGPDVPENVIVVCPNHHALLDYGAISLKLDGIRDHHLQRIDPRYLAYHNERLVGTQTDQDSVRSIE